MLKTIILICIGWAGSASAIVVTDYTTAETAPSGMDWSYVYSYKGSSAVAVGYNWLLTAAHVADDAGSGSLNIEGAVYNQQEIIFHVSADLALVRYDRALPGAYGLYTGYIPQTFSDPKLAVLMVGYGTIGSVYTDYWIDGGTGRNTKRWGSQEIDTSDDSYKNSGTDSKAFRMYFDLGDTLYEAGAGFGDSGGGTFYKDGDTWKLAGINTGIGGSVSGFDRTYAVSIPEYADWIHAVIPEPEVINLMNLSTMGLFIARSVRRSKRRIWRGLLSGRMTYLCDSYSAQETKRREEAQESWF